jgi:hypothetical protein
MPSYQASFINKHVEQASPGLSAYFYGGLNRTVQATKMTVTAVQLTSPTAVVTGTVIEGQIPIVGQKVSISGAVPSYFNVTDAVITVVTSPATPDVGVYSISFSLTNSNIGTTASPGLAIAPAAETSETIVNGASTQIALQANTGVENPYDLRVDVSFPTSPIGATVVVQTAQLDIDSEYQTLGTVASIAASTLTGGSAVYANVMGSFVRLKVSGLAGSGKIIGKLMV